MSNITPYNRQRNNGLMPQSLQDKLLMAEQLAKSGLMPASLKTPQQVFVALQWGHELGLSPMVAVNNIMVVNGKPTLATDLMHTLVRANPEYGGCEWKSMTDEHAEVVVIRTCRAGNERYTGYFDMETARKAGLAGKDVWMKYPRRMLKHRALAYALRDAFPDTLAGIYTPEELVEMRNVTEPRESPAYEEPAPPPPAEEAIKNRKRLIEEIAQILTMKSSDLIPYFTDEERAAEKELIKKTGPDERGITCLEAQKTRLALELEERIEHYKPIPIEGAPLADAVTGEEAARMAEQDADGPERESRSAAGLEEQKLGTAMYQRIAEAAGFVKSDRDDVLETYSRRP